MSNLKMQLRRFLPYRALRFWARLKNRRGGQGARDLRAVFTDIYKSNLWGGAPGDFFSGSGSDMAASSDFVHTVNAFILENHIQSVVDLGCGDFRVGGQIARADLDYVGVDVVGELIVRNQAAFGQEGVRFMCANIVEDELPDGELCLVRQVLQHLSNEQIQSILRVIRRYRYAIIAEHHPGSAHFIEANLDKLAGSDVRVYLGSGVYLDKPPFSLGNVEILCQSSPSKWLLSSDETITTYLVRNAVG